jgi:hypothetical protein
MYTKNNLYFLLAITLPIILTGCGTFEIGIESNTILEPTVQTVEVPLEPTSIPPAEEPTVLPDQAEEPTAQPDLSDEAKIGAALAERMGFAIGEVPFTISQLTEEHASGNISNGYFLAVKLDGQWVAVFDGQANPYCREVDLYAFPMGMVPECLSDSNQLIVRSGSVNPPTSSLQSLDCGPGSAGANPGTAMYVACNVQDALLSRNTSVLLGYMVDPFIIGYWLSEGVSESPEIQIQTIQGLYNFHDPDYTPRLTFTTNRDLFPELDGRPLEGRFGPDVNVAEVVYSRGWGEGDQEALIFISQDSAGNFKWHSMLTGDLDIPVPSP